MGQGDRHDSTPEPAWLSRVGRTRWIVYPVLLALTGLALAARFDAGSSSAGSAPDAHPRLAGTTEQRYPVSISFDEHGRMRAFYTQVVGLCDNGWTWSESWSPDSPRIAFRAGPSGTSIREAADETDAHGHSRHLVLSTTARLGARGATAEGDVRFTGRFSRPGRPPISCDSGYVHWTARTWTKGQPAPPGENGPTASLAVNPSRARLAFAARVDAQCALAGPRIEASERAARERFAGRRDEQRGAVFAAYLDAHAREYLAIRRLGHAPQAGGLYEAFLGNMRKRLELERTQMIQLIHGRTAQARATAARVTFLKVVDNALGQEFGIRLCTENGRVGPEYGPARKVRRGQST